MVGGLVVDCLVILGSLAVEAGGLERGRLGLGLDFEVCFGLLIGLVASLGAFVTIFLLLPGAFPLAEK